MAALAVTLLFLIIDIAWAYVYLRLRRNLIPFILTPSIFSRNSDDRAGSLVSVIIAARNEQENIANCIGGYLGQSYQNLEIIVVDDNSDDETRSIALSCSAASGTRIKVLTKGEPPPDWVGKQHAMEAGAEAARGEWLLFADADAQAHPDAVRTALSLAMEQGLHLVSFSPEQLCLSPWEKVVQPAIYRFLNLRYQYGRVNDPSLPDAAAHGAFLLIRGDIYKKIGGFRAVRQSFIDDADLAAIAKSRGYRLHFAPVRGLVKIRMYNCFAEIFGGWAKNSFAFFQYRWWLLLKNTCLFILLSLAPFALLPIALASGQAHAQIAATISLAYILLLDSSLRGIEGFSKAWSFSLPVGNIIALAIFIKSAANRAAGAKTSWKGRRY